MSISRGEARDLLDHTLSATLEPDVVIPAPGRSLLAPARLRTVPTAVLGIA